jgi:voltage-gated sodium channel
VAWYHTIHSGVHNTTSIALSFRARVTRLVASNAFEYGILAVILLNAVTLGIETSAVLLARFGDVLYFFDQLFLSIFIVELCLKLFAYGASFFRNGWNLFDAVVVGIALIPASGPFAVLRGLRVLRVFRLVSAAPSMRRVIEAFMHTLSGLTAVGAVLLVVFYVSAVMSVTLFGTAFHEFFGTVGRALYSLFQIMTLESWSMGIVRPVMGVYPYAWLFFVPFILVTTFAVLNLLIGIIVNSMQEIHEREQKELSAQLQTQTATTEVLYAKLVAVETLLREIRKHMNVTEK